MVWCRIVALEARKKRCHCLWAFGCDNMLSTKDVQWRQWRWTWYMYNKIPPNQLVRRREMSKSIQWRRWHSIEGSDRTRSPIRPHYSIYLPIVQIGSRRQWQWHTGFDIWKIALEEVNAIERLSRLLQNAGNNKQLVYSYCWAETTCWITVWRGRGHWRRGGRLPNWPLDSMRGALWSDWNQSLDGWCHG